MIIAQRKYSVSLRTVAGIIVAGLVAVLLSYATAPISESDSKHQVYLTPEVSTNEASRITSTSATLNGTLESLGIGSYVVVMYEWGTSTAYNNETDAKVMTSPGTYSSSLMNLKPNTTYHFRAKAAATDLHYGEGTSFTTSNEAVPLGE